MHFRVLTTDIHQKNISWVQIWVKHADNPILRHFILAPNRGVWSRCHLNLPKTIPSFGLTRTDLLWETGGYSRTSSPGEPSQAAACSSMVSCKFLAATKCPPPPLLVTITVNRSKTPLMATGSQQLTGATICQAQEGRRCRGKCHPSMPVPLV